MYDNNLQQLRKEIDIIDNKLICLIAKRDAIVRKIAIHKKQHNLPIVDEARESELFIQYNNLADHYGISKTLISQIFKHIIMHARNIQE